MERRRFVLALLLMFTLVSGTHNVATSAPPGPAEFQRYADSLLTLDYRADRPGASVLVARGSTVLLRTARGIADMDAHQPLRPDSRFRIASVTKQITAAGLLTLVEAGKVKLDDPLSRYIADFPAGDRITILQLLDHTAGVRNYTNLPGYVDDVIRRDLTTPQLIDLFRDQKPDFAPGTGWEYSNSGYVLLGAVIEAVTGKPWHRYLQDALFEPLGMKQTGYGHDPRVASRTVSGYSAVGDSVVPMRPLSMTQPHAAGGLVSTVDDLLIWSRALHHGRVLKNATYTRMVTPAGKAVNPGYGFGLYVDQVRTHKAYRHGGSMFGFVSSLTYLPDADITVVVLENDDAPNPSEDAHTLVRRLAAKAVGDPYPEARAIAVDAATLQKAEGVYRFGGDTVRVLRVVDGKLTAQRNRSPRAPLTPIAPDEFLYPDGFNRILLVRDPAGAIRGMRFHPRGDGSGEVGTRTGDSLSATPHAVQLPRAALERLVGTFARGALTLRVYLEAEVLMAVVGGQDPVHLRATSATLFEVEETGATLEFPAGDRVAQVTVRQGRREVVLERVP